VSPRPLRPLGNLCCNLTITFVSVLAPLVIYRGRRYDEIEEVI